MGKHDGKKSLRRRWLRDVVDWFQLDEVRDHWLALVNTVMNLKFHNLPGVTIKCSRAVMR